MKKNIVILKINDLVYSFIDQDWIQIRNDNQLQKVETLWGSQFFGLQLSEELINIFWSEFRPKYHSEYIKKFDYIDDYNNEKKIFSFFGEYSKKKLPPICEAIMSDGSECMVQLFTDSEVFKKCYCFCGGKKIYFKYVHELQSIMDNFKINRCIHGGFNFISGVKEV